MKVWPADEDIEQWNRDTEGMHGVQFERYCLDNDVPNRSEWRRVCDRCKEYMPVNYCGLAYLPESWNEAYKVLNLNNNWTIKNAPMVMELIHETGFYDVCERCGVDLLPTVQQAVDVYGCFIFLNRLKGAINERKKYNRNNWATSYYAGERCEGGVERRLGYTESRSDSQTGKEHF